MDFLCSIYLKYQIYYCSTVSLLSLTVQCRFPVDDPGQWCILGAQYTHAACTNEGMEIQGAREKAG